MKSSKWVRAGWYALFVLMLVWPALHNMFPLVTPDSGTYIHSGLALSMPTDRPWGYGIFLLLSSWAVSPWFPVFWQGFFCAWLLILLGKKCLGNNLSYPFWAGIILIVSFGTACAWYNSQLMADAFTGLMLLCILLLYVKPESRKQRNQLNAFLIACLVMHHSHIMEVFLVGLGLTIYFAKRHLLFERKVSVKLMLYAMSIGLVISTVNYIGHYGFGLSPHSPTFMLSRMAENGILDTYLKDKCPTEPNILCGYQGKTGLRQWDFMWSGNLPHTQGLNEDSINAIYGKIVRSTLRNPKYLSMHMLKNTEAGMKQLSQLEIREGLEQTYPANSFVYQTIQKEFPSYIKEFETDSQNHQELPLVLVSIVTISFAVLTMVLALFVHRYNSRVAGKEEQALWANLFVIAILFIGVNAFVTATFSTVIARLQARIFWVLPVLCLFYFIKMLQHKFPGWFNYTQSVEP